MVTLTELAVPSLTLSEHIINELKISKASTGNRLDMEPTFGELQSGDTVYWVTAATKSIEDATCKVIQKAPEKIEGLINPEKDAYTDDSPSVRKPVLRDLRLVVKNEKGKSPKDNVVISVPSQNRGMAIFLTPGVFFICSTSLDFVLNIIKIHKLHSKL